MNFITKLLKHTMGTVHAKVSHRTPYFAEDEAPLFEFDDLEEDPPPRSSIALNGIKARVDRVNVDGLDRTQDDVIRGTVDDLFKAQDFEDVIVRAHKVRQALDNLGCFRNICVYIDVSSGPDATPDGLEVTFQVREMSRVTGGVNASVGENEGSVVFGLRLPNLFGRGERAQAAYSHGYRNTASFNVTVSKPLHLKPYSPVVSGSIYQHSQDYPWSGYHLLDRGVLFDVAFKTSPTTKHTVQWEGLVRDVTVLNKTSFKIRESSGPHLKSVLRHTISVDHRDEEVFPTQGVFVQLSHELAGLGGSVAHVRAELRAQASHTLNAEAGVVLQASVTYLGVFVTVTYLGVFVQLSHELAELGGSVAHVRAELRAQASHTLNAEAGVVLQACAAAGVLHDVYGTAPPDHFFLGGPTSVRGFQQRGLGPHCDGQAVGGRAYWASGVHLFAPLPVPGGRTGLGALFRSHLFLNAGCLAFPEHRGQWSGAQLQALSLARVSLGLGLCVRLGRAARLELNYVLPLRALPPDRPYSGLQLGLGASFL
ncbi:sorting and assembly machinery component 50 homolog B [Helicoverpa armigera]|uniref:sorting and assembly machinery component 50 homolog B n=1 Tax=Helicoverpa armigera TaxID=29058 RepID=UPI0030827CD3